MPNFRARLENRGNSADKYLHGVQGDVVAQDLRWERPDIAQRHGAKTARLLSRFGLDAACDIDQRGLIDGDAAKLDRGPVAEIFVAEFDVGDADGGWKMRDGGIAHRYISVLVAFRQGARRVSQFSDERSTADETSYAWSGPLPSHRLPVTVIEPVPLDPTRGLLVSCYNCWKADVRGDGHGNKIRSSPRSCALKLPGR